MMLPPGRMIEMLASETAMDKGLNSMFRQRKKLTSDYRLQEKFDVCLTLFTARIEVDKGSNERFRHLGPHKCRKSIQFFVAH